MPAQPGPLWAWLWRPMLEPESRRWVSSAISGLREGVLPRARCKVQHGFRFPVASWQNISRGNVPSDGGVERYVCVWRRANRGRSSLGSDGAVNYTDQMLNGVIPKTHPQLCEASGWECCVGGSSTPAQAAAPACRLVGGPGGELLCRAHADAQWNWHSPSLLLHHAWLMGPFSFKLFSLSFSLFVCF